MTYETYVLILCGVVYVALTAVTIATILSLTRMTLGLIRHGAQDKDIIKHYAKAKRKVKGKKERAVDVLASIFLCSLFAIVFGFSLYVNVNEETYFDNVPTLKVVLSSSMSKKNEKNTYLEKNGLDDQFGKFDMILVYAPPAEEDLKLYDVVVYEFEYEGETVQIVHRIVGIEEANEKHGRRFKTQGDAVESADSKGVEYSQIKAVYRGEKVPFIGSFVLFMQSPAGWMCMILMLAATIATPIVDKILEKARWKRYLALCKKQEEEKKQAQAKAMQAKNGPLVAAPVCLYPVYYDPNKFTPPPVSIPVRAPMQMPMRTSTKAPTCMQGKGKKN